MCVCVCVCATRKNEIGIAMKLHIIYMENPRLSLVRMRRIALFLLQYV